MEMLYCPHLMLSYIGSHNSVLRQQSCDGFGNLLRRKGLSAFLVFGFGLEREYIFFPLAVILLLNLIVENFQNPLGVADYVMVGSDIFVYFGSVYIYLDYLCLNCEAFRIQRHTV